MSHCELLQLFSVLTPAVAGLSWENTVACHSSHGDACQLRLGQPETMGRTDGESPGGGGEGGVVQGLTASSSVAAGLPIQEKPMMLRAALSISPSMPGALELAG